ALPIFDCPLQAATGDGPVACRVGLVDEVLHGLDPRIPRLDLFECVECSAALVECGLSPFVPGRLGLVCAALLVLPCEVGFVGAVMGAAGGGFGFDGAEVGLLEVVALDLVEPLGFATPFAGLLLCGARPPLVDGDGAATDRGLCLGACGSMLSSGEPVQDCGGVRGQ